jgi:ABC-type phosphate/phosphonate transport system substrate-binding protein
MNSWKIGLPMYYGVAAADHSELLHQIADQFAAHGLTEPIEVVTEVGDLDEFWLRRDLLLGQACGFPLMTRLAGKVTLLGTLGYAFPGCEGHCYRSFILVRADSGLYTLKDLQGRIAAVNQWHSHSGMNAFRLALAPHARRGRHFSRVIESGSHRASLSLLQRREADVAAIDCITYGYLRRHTPQALDGVRVLHETASMPGLPLLSSLQAGDSLYQLARTVLAKILQTGPGDGAAKRLGLTGFTETRMSDYCVIVDAEQQAISCGYPQLA